MLPKINNHSVGAPDRGGCGGENFLIFFNPQAWHICHKLNKQIVIGVRKGQANVKQVKT